MGNMTSSSLDIPQQPDRPHMRFDREFIPLRGPYGRSYDNNAQVQLHNLCVKCKEVENLWQYMLALKPPRPWRKHMREFQHHRPASLLRESYRRGCHLCSIIWGAFTSKKYGTLENDKDWHHNKENWRVTLLLNLSVGDHWPERQMGARLCPPDRHTCVHHSSSDCHLAGRAMFLFPPDEGFQPRTSVTPISTKNAVCGTFYKTCKDICDRNHKRCHRKRDGQLPTRLLSITKDPSDNGTAVRYCVRLISTRDQGFSPKDVEYAALSYC